MDPLYCMYKKPCPFLCRKSPYKMDKTSLTYSIARNDLHILDCLLILADKKILLGVQKG